MGEQNREEDDDPSLPVKGRGLSLTEPIVAQKKRKSHAKNDHRQQKWTRQLVDSYGHLFVETASGKQQQNGRWNNNSTNGRKVTTRDLIEITDDHDEQHTNARHALPVDEPFEYDGKNKPIYKPMRSYINELCPGKREKKHFTSGSGALYGEILVETRVSENFDSSVELLVSSGSDEVTKKSEMGNAVSGSSPRGSTSFDNLSRCSVAQQLQLIANCNKQINPNLDSIMQGEEREKTYTYKNRFGQKIIMKKNRPNGAQNTNNGEKPEDSRKIEDIMAFLNEADGIRKDIIKNKGKKRRTKAVTKTIVVEASKPKKINPKIEQIFEEPLVIDEADLMVVEMMIQGSDEDEIINNDIISDVEQFVEPVTLRVTELMESISSIEVIKNTFITRADSFPTLNEANFKEDQKRGKHRQSAKSGVPPNKKTRKRKEKSADVRKVKSPAKDDCQKAGKEPFIAKVIIVDEDPSTPIDNIVQLHGITFCYDQGLECRDGDEKSRRLDIMNEKVEETRVKTASDDLAGQKLLIMVLSPCTQIPQQTGDNMLLSNVTKETLDRYEKIVAAWNDFQNKGAKPYVYKCEKTF